MTESVRTRGSISRRLTLQLAAIAALLALLSWGMIRGFSQQAAEQTQDNILAASVTAIAEELRSEAGQIRLEIPYAAFSMLGAINEERVFYRIVSDGETLTGYDDLPVVQDGEISAGVTFETLTYRGDSVRMAMVGRTLFASERAVPVLVAVAQTRNAVDAISARISRAAALVSVAFFVLAAGLSFWAARVSLRPLTAMAQTVARRGPSDLSPFETTAPHEIAPLLAALNRFMDRLSASLSRSEDFIAEAAHRVRTPLATVRTQAEIALHAVTRDENKEIMRRVIRAVDESSRSAGQLLDHAMVSFRTDNLTRNDVDLVDLVTEVVNGLRPTAEMKDIRILTELSPLRVQGDAILLQNALRNVLDNAIKYSPADSRVTITLRQAGAGAEIRICDQGRGVNGADTATLTERFRRGENVGNVVGSGLGLTIAHEVARAHGGRLDLAPARKGTGTCVTLSLPFS
ncbi:sensor histidine kinase [Rhodobacteraceae bacterium WD3A24]|nr:sensor histidine kinase [Rhodobacteraceae bacterium WD3A24]